MYIMYVYIRNRWALWKMGMFYEYLHVDGLEELINCMRLYYITIL